MTVREGLRWWNGVVWVGALLGREEWERWWRWRRYMVQLSWLERLLRGELREESESRGVERKRKRS